MAALAILIATVWWFRRRKRRAPVIVAQLEDESKPPAVLASPGELEGALVDSRTKARELCNGASRRA